MPTYEVSRGDTVWGLTRRAFQEQFGRTPTNLEILQIVRQVQVPSGNVDLIRPGEQVTIPIGPGYDGGGPAPFEPPPGFDPPFGPEPGDGSRRQPPSSPDYPFGPSWDGPTGEGVVPSFPGLPPGVERIGPRFVPDGPRQYPIPPEVRDPGVRVGPPRQYGIPPEMQDPRPAPGTQGRRYPVPPEVRDPRPTPLPPARRYPLPPEVRDQPPAAPVPPRQYQIPPGISGPTSPMAPGVRRDPYSRFREVERGAIGPYFPWDDVYRNFV